MSTHDPVALRDAAEALAREAGAILLEGHGQTHAPERKGRIDLVTEYDRRSERLLLDRADSTADRVAGRAAVDETGDTAAAGAAGDRQFGMGRGRDEQR